MCRLCSIIGLVFLAFVFSVYEQGESAAVVNSDEKRHWKPVKIQERYLALEHEGTSRGLSARQKLFREINITDTDDKDYSDVYLRGNFSDVVNRKNNARTTEVTQRISRKTTATTTTTTTTKNSQHQRSRTKHMYYTSNKQKHKTRYKMEEKQHKTSIDVITRKTPTQRNLKNTKSGGNSSTNLLSMKNNNRTFHATTFSPMNVSFNSTISVSTAEPAPSETDMDNIDTLRKIYAEVIKLDILQMLKLPIEKRFPGKTRHVAPFFIPYMVQNDGSDIYSLDNEEDLGQGHKPVMSSVIIPASTDTLRRRKRFSFSLPRNIKIGRVQKATLWVYKKSHRPGRYEHITISTTKFNISKFMRIGTYWMKIDLTDIASDWIKRRSKVLKLTAKCRRPRQEFSSYRRCPIQTHGHKRPLLSIVVGKRRRRSRRSTNMCSAGQTSCCREELTVNLNDISYIWYPLTFRADFCRGRCRTAEMGRSSSLVANYARYLFLYAVSTGLERYTTGCCVSTKRRPLSVGYYDNDNNLISAILPGMRVTECGCRV